MPELKTDWSYPVLETTLDKRLERPGVQRGYSSEMTGVDGRSEGGLKPFPGFKLVHRMTQLQNQANHGILSVVKDFKPIDFRIGSEYYGYGFVYRAQRTNNAALADVFIDYWDSVNQAWTYCYKIMNAVSSTDQFDVQVAGRFVYCFVAGRSPALFYIAATRTKEYAAEADAHLLSVSPTVNNGTAATLELLGGANPRHVLWRFDTSAEATKTVETAFLEFTVSGTLVSTSGGVNVTVNPVTDPGASGVLWNETEVTWNNRTTATAWSTAGGSYNGLVGTTVNVPKGFLGKVSVDLKTIVQDCLNSVHQTFTSKVDVIARNSLSELLSIVGRGQTNPAILPKLTVTYTNKVFLTPTVVGLLGTGTIPGPGKQPVLASPERGIAGGSYTTVDTERPATAQVLLEPENPYSNEDNFPDPQSGLCAGDTFPAAGAPFVPGTALVHSPTAGACSATLDGITDANLVIQLLTPANRQTSVSVTPRLDWTAFYENGGALSANMKFDVFLVQEDVGNLGSKCVTAGSPLPWNQSYFEPASLWPSGKMPYGKKFLWKVVARRIDCDDFYIESTVGSFTTENKYQARKFEAGDYSFGYQLVDSKTGRQSALSNIAQVRSEDFTVTRTQGGNAISVKQDQYMGVELVYDSAKYDLMYVYRSVKIQDAGGTMIAGLLFLDRIVKLSDYLTCKNGAGVSYTFNTLTTSNRHAMYFYELEDKQLVYQNPYVDRSVFDETMPYGGAALFYQSTMLVSRIETPTASTTEESRNVDPHRGLGEMRWSSLMEMSPELFPPFNRYNPTIPSNEVICFARIGANVAGISRDKVYHIRKSGPYVKVTEMHEGYGIVNHKAVDSVGSAAYYVSSHGLKSVDMQGQLDEIRNLNSVFVREWRTDLTSVQVAHDPFMNCLFVHNPVQAESYVLWFSTGKTTKVADANFDLAAQGPWPINFTTNQYGNDLCRRAFFLQNNQETRASGTGFNVFAGPAIYIVDDGATKTISGGTTSWNGARRITTLDFAGDSRFVASGAASSGVIPISTGTGTVVSTDAWKFAYAYLVHSTTIPQHIGKKFKVMYNTASNVYYDPLVVGGWASTVTAGDVFVVSPIVFEWAGHPLALTTEQGMVFSNADLFRMKVISSVGAAFTDVSGPPTSDSVTAATPLDRYTGLVYSGTLDAPVATAQTKDTNGNLYSSVEDDEGVVYAAFGSDASDGKYGVKGTTLTPGIRILCPDLDFRLLGCIVRGTITAVERTNNIRGS
jgi:hypothetical protein